MAATRITGRALRCMALAGGLAAAEGREVGLSLLLVEGRGAEAERIVVAPFLPELSVRVHPARLRPLAPDAAGRILGGILGLGPDRLAPLLPTLGPLAVVAARGRGGAIRLQGSWTEEPLRPLLEGLALHEEEDEGRTRLAHSDLAGWHRPGVLVLASRGLAGALVLRRPSSLGHRVHRLRSSPGSEAAWAWWRRRSEAREALRGLLPFDPEAAPVALGEAACGLTLRADQPGVLTQRIDLVARGAAEARQLASWVEATWAGPEKPRFEVAERLLRMRWETDPEGAARLWGPLSVRLAQRLTVSALAGSARFSGAPAGSPPSPPGPG